MAASGHCKRFIYFVSYLRKWTSIATLDLSFETEINYIKEFFDFNLSVVWNIEHV